MMRYFFRKKNIQREFYLFAKYYESKTKEVTEEQFKGDLGITFGASPSSIRERFNNFLKLGFIKIIEGKKRVKFNWEKIDAFYKKAYEYEHSELY